MELWDQTQSIDGKRSNEGNKRDRYVPVPDFPGRIHDRRLFQFFYSARKYFYFYRHPVHLYPSKPDRQISSLR